MSTAAAFLLTFGASALGAIAALGFDAFGQRRSSLLAALAGTGVAAVAGVAMAVRSVPSGLVGTLQVGGPAAMVFGVIALTGMAAIAAGWDELLESPNGGSIAGLIALGVLAAGATALAIDLTSVLLAIETSAVCAYALVALGRTSRSAEAAMKYFVQGAVATGLFVFGMAILVGVFDPSGRYDALAQALVAPSQLYPAIAGVILVLAALIFKMGAAPMHSWAPDAYETAPVPGAAFLASGQKMAAIAAASLLVAMLGAGTMSPRIVTILVGVAALSVLVGSLAALRQSNYRRLLAYAGVAQVGYALLAAALFTPPIAVFFAATYAISSVGTFSAAGAFRRIRPAWDGSVRGLAGLGHEAPAVGGSVAILLVSLAGLPPLLGFWGKLVVFGTAINLASLSHSTVPQTTWVLAIGVGVALLGSVISLGYYGSILRALFLDREDAGDPAAVADTTDAAPISKRTMGGSAGLVVVALAVLVVVAGLATTAFGSTLIFQLFAAR